MSDGSKEAEFGQAEAEALLMAGWTQGSVFLPNEHVQLPAGMQKADAHLVVCTQACTLVSSSLTKDPWVELAVAVPVLGYSSKSEAATGKEVRRYHLPVAQAGFDAVEIDINARFAVRRDILLAFAPAGPKATEEACRAFAGWIGRYYTRIALPNELVARLKDAVFQPLTKFLKAAPKGSGSKNHESVHSIYVRWGPSAELAPGDRYEIDFLILCDEGGVADALEARLVEIGLDPDSRSEKEGLVVGCNVQARNETRLTDLDGWTRLTEWDHLTGLGEAAEMPE